MVAVEADREEVVREMVAVQGADITTRDAEGRSLEEVGRWVFGALQPHLPPYEYLKSKCIKLKGGEIKNL